MSDGAYWRMRKAQGRLRESEDAREQVRRLLTEALNLLGGPVTSPDRERILKGALAHDFFKPLPVCIGYATCDGCSEERKCYQIDSGKLCMGCRKKGKEK